MHAHMFSNEYADQSPWQMRFEDERVKMVLEAFKLLDHLRALNNDCYARENQRRLTFQSFHKLLPTFPILLSVSCHGRVAERCPPVTLFRRFDDVFLMHDYLAAYARFQDEAQDRPIGLVVPFDGYRGGMIIHNGDFGTRSTKMTHPVPDDAPPHRVTVEPFLALIHYLALGQWTPKSPRPDSSMINKLELSPDMPITPWMVQTLGTNPALAVLAWLRKVLMSESAYDRLYVRRLNESERCVQATHEQIAAQTGLSLRQVQRGLKDLIKKKLASSVGKTARSGLALTSAALAGSDDC